jgi:hypothetical protein
MNYAPYGVFSIGFRLSIYSLSGQRQYPSQIHRQDKMPGWPQDVCAQEVPFSKCMFEIGIGCRLCALRDSPFCRCVIVCL